jgi:hypothetical protein
MPRPGRTGETANSESPPSDASQSDSTELKAFLNFRVRVLEAGTAAEVALDADRDDDEVFAVDACEPARAALDEGLCRPLGAELPFAGTAYAKMPNKQHKRQKHVIEV